MHNDIDGVSEEELAAHAEWVARSTKLARSKDLNGVPDAKYIELFWEVMGFLENYYLDEWSLVFLHSLLDRLELEVM